MIDTPQVLHPYILQALKGTLAQLYSGVAIFFDEIEGEEPMAVLKVAVLNVDLPSEMDFLEMWAESYVAVDVSALNEDGLLAEAQAQSRTTAMLIGEILAETNMEWAEEMVALGMQSMIDNLVSREQTSPTQEIDEDSLNPELN